MGIRTRPLTPGCWLLASALVLAGCGSTTPESSGPRVTVAESAFSAIEVLGINSTGRTDISQAQWVEIATRACDEGAWDHAVAEQIAGELIGELAPGMPENGGATTVWLMLPLACHDRIPVEAIERGPPGLDSEGQDSN